MPKSMRSFEVFRCEGSIKRKVWTRLSIFSDQSRRSTVLLTLGQFSRSWNLEALMTPWRILKLRFVNGWNFLTANFVIISYPALSLFDCTLQFEGLNYGLFLAIWTTFRWLVRVIQLLEFLPFSREMPRASRTFPSQSISSYKSRSIYCTYYS